MDRMNAVLVVDDNESDLLLIERALKRSECCDKVFTAENGIEALQFLQNIKDGKNVSDLKSPPELILLDLSMPRMNGFDFLEEYTNSNLGSNNTSIVILTTSINGVDMEKTRKYGATKGYLTKPLSTFKVKDSLLPLLNP